LQRRSTPHPQRHAIVSVVVRILARFDRQYEDFTAKAPGFVEFKEFANGGKDSENARHSCRLAGAGDFNYAGDAHGISPSVTTTASHLFETRCSGKAGIAAARPNDCRSASDNKGAGEQVDTRWG